MFDMITGLTIRGFKHGSSFGGHFAWKILFVAFAVFWLIMLFNCLQRRFESDMDKIAWIIVLVFIPIVGAFLYLFSLNYKLRMGKRNPAKKRKKR